MNNETSTEVSFLYLISDENNWGYARIFTDEDDAVKFARTICDTEPDSHPMLTIFRNGGLIENYSLL